MPLKIGLRPHEKVFIAGAVVQNGPTPAELTILNSAPILREPDVLREEQADTPGKRLYFCIQLMYIDPLEVARYRQHYQDLKAELLKCSNANADILDRIDAELGRADYYRAMKLARRLEPF
jgi:flagellar protein FlbT